ncbi:SPASM domain-containing protein [Enterococcus crotali]|uniref:SPASM domain-containing protein n=1 Tax=Enterococcus crotali TaxID=1453587 RepID=UPI003B84A78A
MKPNMVVTPCAMMRLNIGNLKQESLKTILNRSFKLFSKLEFPDSKQCSTCSEENYCKRCISEAIIRKDSVSVCNWEVKHQGILCKII